MTATPARRLGRFAAALGALLLFVVVAPALLLAAAQRRFGGSSPFAGVPAPVDWDREAVLVALRDPLADEVVVDVIVRASLVVAWVALLSIVVTTMLEAVHLVRHRGMSMPMVRGLAWSQPLARSIAAGLLVLAPLMTPRSSLAAAVAGIETDVGPHAEAAAAAPVTGVSMPAELADGTHPVAPTVHVVERGESIYSIAERLAADSSMTVTEVADALLDANLGSVMNGGQCFTTAAYIEVGWELVVPAPLLQDVAARPEISHLPDGLEMDVIRAAGAERPSGNVETHVVSTGESLSAIAAARLGDAGAWPLIWERNAGAEMPNGRFFDDPDLILPGWELDIPVASVTDAVDATVDADAPGGDPSVSTGASSTPGSTPIGPDSGIATATSSMAPETPSRPAPASDDVPEPVTEPDPARSASVPAVASNGSPAAPAEPVASPSGIPAPTFAPPPPQSAVPATTATTTTEPTAPPEAERSGVAPVAPAPLRFEHAALFAAGIITLLGVRRRLRLRRAIPSARLPTPRPDAVSAERRLRTVEIGERASRVDVGVRAAAHELIGSDARIGMVLVGADGDVELVLTRPARLSPPWSTGGDAALRRWILPANVPVESLADAARQVGAPCIALVQLGVADDRDVLIDLEACGTLVIDSVDTDPLVHALAAGLASAPSAEIAHLIGVSLPEQALLGHRNAHHADSVGSAFELASTLVGTTIGQDRTAFELRSLHTGGDAWEPAIILLTSHDVDELDRAEIDLPTGGHGLAVVAPASSGVVEGVRARLVGTGDVWTIDAFDTVIALRPVGLPPGDLDELAALVTDADAPLEIEITANANEQSLGDPPIIVRLMGDVDVISRGGEPGAFERSKTVELIAWLATHREKSTRTAARTALWELDVRDATFANVVSEARRGLGRLVPPPDGDEWLARTLTEHLPLHPAVVTDAQLIEARLAVARGQSTAEAIETLKPAAEMLRDMPFAGTSYLWPDAEGITSSLVLLATAVSTELAEHALAVGDVELVFWATGRGLAVLPGHEALIGLRMRAHADSGDLAGVRSEWESYERVIVADPWSDGEPAPKLLEIRRELLA